MTPTEPTTQAKGLVPLPAGFVHAHIAERRSLTPSVEQFDLVFDEPITGEIPGSHFELLIPYTGEGTDEDEPAVRHYSICAVEGNRASIAVLRDDKGRGGSVWLHEHARTGEAVAVRGPRNTFPFHGSGRSLLIAGGIGITPLILMIDEAKRNGIDWELVYLGRRLDSMAYADRLAEQGDRVTLWPSAEQGRFDLAGLLSRQHAGTTVYACGPRQLQDQLRTLAMEYDLKLVVEDFASGSPLSQGPVSRDGRPSLSFTVELADGTEVFVPEDHTIIEALNEAGVRVLSSCKRGTCGTCETPILEGSADHRDEVLSDEEKASNESMMICVSRACGDRIVLDL